jgi:hypothetical protein
MRHLSTLALAGLFGGLLLVGDASACHKKKCACPAPVTYCAPAPVVCAPAPVVCAAPKAKHHFKMPKISLCHKTAAPACATYGYAAPVSYATPQSYPTGQASHQGM